jgi:hypothetical protein
MDKFSSHHVGAASSKLTHRPIIVFCYTDVSKCMCWLQPFSSLDRVDPSVRRYRLDYAPQSATLPRSIAQWDLL